MYWKWKIDDFSGCYSSSVTNHTTTTHHRMGTMQFDFTDYAGMEYDPREGCLYLDCKTGMAYIKLLDVKKMDMKQVLEDMIAKNNDLLSIDYSEHVKYVDDLRNESMVASIADVSPLKAAKLLEYGQVSNILLFNMPEHKFNAAFSEYIAQTTHDEASYVYEQLASYYSILALREVNKNTSESFGTAIEYLQRATGAFTVSDKLANVTKRRDKTDEENDVLKIVRAAMFTQCHELEFKRGLKDKVPSEKSFIMAKRTHDCYAWLTMATKHSMNYDEIVVIDVFEFKTDYYRCIVYTYCAINCLKKDKYGEAIACFEKCLEIIDSTFEKMFDDIPEFACITDELTKLREKITDNLTKCKHENDTKHKQKIPIFKNFKIKEFEISDVIYPKLDDAEAEKKLYNLFADIRTS